MKSAFDSKTRPGIERLWYGSSAAAVAARAALSPASLLFSAASRLRGVLYDRGSFDVGRAPAPVISVGSLRVGGAGKTPFVLWLAAALIERGLHPCIVTRGYGGRAGREPFLLDPDKASARGAAAYAGDEAVLLALRSGLTIAVGANRLAACRLAAAVRRPSLFLLDDGFQHRALARELDIVLVAGTESRERLLPAGPLRESTAALRRAQVVVLMKSARDSADQPRPGREVAATPTAAASPASAASADNAQRTLPQVRATLDEAIPPRATARATLKHAPLELRASVRASSLVERVGDGDGVALSALRGRRVVAVAGIARPERFLADLEAAGADIVARVLRGDHHRFDDKDRREIDDAAAAADLVVTTEKDLVKLAGLGVKARMRALRIEIALDGGADGADDGAEGEGQARGAGGVEGRGKDRLLDLIETVVADWSI